MELKNKYTLGLIGLATVLIVTVVLFWDKVYLDVYQSELPEGALELITLFPDMRPFGWTIGAIIFLSFYELITIWITDKKGNTISARQSVNLLMGLKVGKILLSLFFILIYSVTVKIEMKHFVLVFLALYLIYLLFDTLYLMSREKEAKKKKLLTKE
jgi:hypothetical protein